MSTPEPRERTLQERILASCAHASVLLGFTPLALIPGILLVIFIWFQHRHKNPWIAFHALQALVYQLVLALLLVPSLVALLLACQPSMGAVCAGLDPRLTGRLWLLFLCALPLLVLFPVFGAIRLLLGKDFGYPLIARCLRTRLKFT